MPSGAGLRGAVKEVARRASAVARLQVELTKTEVADTGKSAGAGAALAAGAAFIGVFAFALLTTLFVVALAIAMPLWLSVLTVLVVYLIVAALLGALARNRFGQAKGPRQAKEQARLTAEALKGRRPETPVAPGEPTEPPPTAVGAGPAPVPVDRAGGAAGG
jgi:hypothetical protein